MDLEKYMQIFEEERLRLELPEIEVKFLEEIPIEYYESIQHWLIVNRYHSTAAGKNEDGTFIAQFHPESCKNEKIFRNRARHELYHLYKNHFKEGLLWYIVVYEPTAMLYAATGIKL